MQLWYNNTNRKSPICVFPSLIIYRTMIHVSVLYTLLSSLCCQMYQPENNFNSCMSTDIPSVRRRIRNRWGPAVMRWTDVIVIRTQRKNKQFAPCQRKPMPCGFKLRVELSAHYKYLHFQVIISGRNLPHFLP